MRDLNKVENKLDEQLAKETRETLSQWLKQKRGKNMKFKEIIGGLIFAAVVALIAYGLLVAVGLV